MPRLYAATGNGIVRLDETGGEWLVEFSLEGSGAQCLAVDPAGSATLYAGLREAGVRRTDDGGRSWVDCALPEQGVFSLAVASGGNVYEATCLSNVAGAVRSDLQRNATLSVPELSRQVEEMGDFLQRIAQAPVRR